MEADNMDPLVARSYEAVVAALRRLRPRLRLKGTTVEHGVRRVHVVGGTPGAWADLLRSLDHADIVRADADVQLEERPVTRVPMSVEHRAAIRKALRASWDRRKRKRKRPARRKPLIPRETFD